MVRVGMISFAHLHAHSYASCLKRLPDAQLVGIADEDTQRAMEMAERHDAKAMSLDELLASDVQAVIVCSENVRHREHVVAAAQAGKHVMCEKPLCISVADGEAMIEACRKAKVQLATAFPCRFSTPIQRLKAVCEAGDLGKLLAIKGTNHGRYPGGWFGERELSGGGAVTDHTVHVADLMRWFLKSEASRVYAETDRLFHPELKVEDCGTLTIEFESGAFASLDPSWSRLNAYPFWGDVTMTVVGTQGTAMVDAFNQKMTVYGEKQNHGDWYFWGSDLDLGLVADFLDAVDQNRTPSATGEDGLRASEVTLAAYQSVEMGRPVTIQELRKT